MMVRLSDAHLNALNWFIYIKNILSLLKCHIFYFRYHAKSVIYGLKSAKIRQKYQVKCLTLLLNMPYILFIERCPDDIILNMLCVIIGSLPAAVITLVISRLYYLSTLI